MMDSEDKTLPTPSDPPLMSLAEASDFLRSEAGDYYAKMIMSYCSFLTFGVESRGNYDDRGNGSCFFLRTPQRLLLVTAGHVYSEFLEAREKDGRVRAFVGGPEFPLAERLIDQGRQSNDDPSNVDIATFSMTDHELKRITGKSAIEYWPPQPPGEENGIALAGFPGEEIRRTRHGLGYGYYVAMVVAKRVTDRQIEIDLGHTDLSEAIVTGNLPHPNYKVGGMSGGPVFTLAYKKSSGILYVVLGGVISENSKYQNDLLFAERADCIRADGSIRR